MDVSKSIWDKDRIPKPSAANSRFCLIADFGGWRSERPLSTQFNEIQTPTERLFDGNSKDKDTLQMPPNAPKTVVETTSNSFNKAQTVDSTRVASIDRHRTIGSMWCTSRLMD